MYIQYTIMVLLQYVLLGGWVNDRQSNTQKFGLWLFISLFNFLLGLLLVLDYSYFSINTLVPIIVGTLWRILWVVIRQEIREFEFSETTLPKLDPDVYFNRLKELKTEYNELGLVYNGLFNQESQFKKKPFWEVAAEVSKLESDLASVVRQAMLQKHEIQDMISEVTICNKKQVSSFIKKSLITSLDHHNKDLLGFQTDLSKLTDCLQVHKNAWATRTATTSTPTPRPTPKTHYTSCLDHESQIRSTQKNIQKFEKCLYELQAKERQLDYTVFTMALTKVIESTEKELEKLTIEINQELALNQACIAEVGKLYSSKYEGEAVLWHLEKNGQMLERLIKDKDLLIEKLNAWVLVDHGATIDTRIDRISGHLKALRSELQDFKTIQINELVEDEAAVQELKKHLKQSVPEVLDELNQIVADGVREVERNNLPYTYKKHLEQLNSVMSQNQQLSFEFKTFTKEFVYKIAVEQAKANGQVLGNVMAVDDCMLEEKVQELWKDYENGEEKFWSAYSALISVAKQNCNVL